MEGCFAEPADVGANAAAASAARESRGRFVEIGVVKWRFVARIAAAFEEFAMHMKNALGARLLVKIVDILGAEEEAIVKFAFKCSEREVARIRFGGGGDAATHGIEIPDKMGIATPSIWRCDFLNAVFSPQATGIAKCGDATFSADAGAGENEKAVGGRDGKVLACGFGELEILLPEGAHGAIEMNSSRAIGNAVLAHGVDHRFKENAMGN